MSIPARDVLRACPTSGPPGPPRGLGTSGVPSCGAVRDRTAPHSADSGETHLLALQRRTLARIIQGAQVAHSSWAHASLRAAACPLEVRDRASVLLPSSAHPDLASAVRGVPRGPCARRTGPCGVSAPYLPA